MLKEIMQGRFMGHPVHPIVVHLVVGLWPAALIFDVLTQFGIGGQALVQASFWAILIGLILAVPAALTGLADFWGIKREKPAWRVGVAHLILNLLVVVLFAFNVGLRWIDHTLLVRVTGLELALSAVGVAVLMVSAYLGATMVYNYGISVARVSKTRWRAAAQRDGAHVPAAE